MPSELYFAYGINLDRADFAGRCPSVRFVGPAVLRGWRFAICLNSKRFRGGVAGIVRESGARVEGAVYEIGAKDLAVLDRFENVPYGMYTREALDVEFADGSRHAAWVYVPGPDAIAELSVAPEYLRRVIDGARDAGVSEGYLKELAAHAPRAADDSGKD